MQRIVSLELGFYDALRAANVPQDTWPSTSWLADPNDYLRPIVFDLKGEDGKDSDR